MDNYYGNIYHCRKCNGIVHTIKKGDTLYLISRFYKVPIGEIMAANREINIYNLQIGDEICIPIKREERINEADMVDNYDTMDTAETLSITRVEINDNSGSTANINTEVENGVIEPEFKEEYKKDYAEMKLSEVMKDKSITLEKFINIMKDII